MIAAAKKHLLIGLVTCAVFPDVTEDDETLQAALVERGVQSVEAAWNDPAVDWGAFDAIVLRSTWDYHMHFPEFSAWLDRLEHLLVPVVNPLPVVRWNADKRYLLQLTEMGVDIIPTRVIAGEALAAHIAERVGEMLVIKPTVSGNSWNTVRGRAGSEALVQMIDVLPSELHYLVQPYLPEVEKQGEWSVIYFDGRFSHAICKRPRSGDYRVQPDFGGSALALEANSSVKAGAQACLAAIDNLGYGDHTYARIDGIVRDGRFLLMEVELIEPALFLRSSPLAAATFADAILAAIGHAAHAVGDAAVKAPGP